MQGASQGPVTCLNEATRRSRPKIPLRGPERRDARVESRFLSSTKLGTFHGSKAPRTIELKGAENQFVNASPHLGQRNFQSKPATLARVGASFKEHERRPKRKSDRGAANKRSSWSPNPSLRPERHDLGSFQGGFVSVGHPQNRSLYCQFLCSMLGLKM